MFSACAVFEDVDSKVEEDGLERPRIPPHGAEVVVEDGLRIVEDDTLIDAEAEGVGESLIISGKPLMSTLTPEAMLMGLEATSSARMARRRAMALAAARARLR